MRELKGWHVLVIILAFFGITIGVNFVFVSYALSTFSGEDETQPYLKGLAYNRTLEAKAAQAALGWQAEIEATRLAGGDAVIRVRVVDQDAQPLNALDIAAQLRHPVNSYLDRRISLSATGEGHYEARVAGLPRGQWDVVAQTQATDGTGFSATRRVLLP
jgi:nitrogen fixation protein FixH